jgi:hypothetical protein
MATNFNSIDSIIGAFTKVLNLNSTGGPPNVPTILLLVGASKRPGLSPTKIASKIIARKPEAGVPVGALPSGSDNPEEIMWRIAIEEIIKAIQQDSVISVAVPRGITVQASGSGPTGPVTVVGQSILPIKAYGVIQ